MNAHDLTRRRALRRCTGGWLQRAVADTALDDVYADVEAIALALAPLDAPKYLPAGGFARRAGYVTPYVQREPTPERSES